MTTAENIAIAELVVYIPILLLTLFVVFRHGFHKQLGWIYLCIFSGIRIAGAIMEILSTKNPDNENDREWAIILQSVGLSPLLLATLGLLKRICDETTTRVPSDPMSPKNILLQIAGFFVMGIFGRLLKIFNKRATAVSYRSKVVQLLHLPALIALILAISGGSDESSSNPSDQSSGKSETRAAIILFLLIYIAACTLWLITLRDVSRMDSGQKRISLAIFIALPLIAVRLLYSLISDFGHNPQFSFINGNTTIQIVMATIEEFLVVCLYTLLGLTLPLSTVHPAIGGGIVPQVMYPLVDDVDEHGRSRSSQAQAAKDIQYAQAASQNAYRQHNSGRNPSGRDSEC